MINKTEALWAANLHVKTSTADKAGTILDTATTLAICRVLVETEARLQRALDHDHGKALEIDAASFDQHGLYPPVPWRTYADPGGLLTPEGEVHARAIANARLTCPTGVLVQAPLEQGGEVTYVPSNLQAIQLCACGHQLPHLKACLMTTDPEQGDAPTPVCARCNDTHVMHLEELGRDVPCTACPVPCSGDVSCRVAGTGAYCATTPCNCACHGAVWTGA